MEIAKGTIPAASDKGWSVAPTVSATDAAATFSQKSVLPDTKKHLDFTYFQTIVTVPAGVKVKTFQVWFDQVDDAARVWIFNDKYPNGKYNAATDVLNKQNMSATADFMADVATGDNRIVIVQYDNAPVENNIKGVRVKVDNVEVKPPTAAEVGVTLYDLPNYGGLKLPYTEGVHDIYSSKVGLNDLVSSVKVKPGWKVTLYEHFQLGGKKLELTSDTPDLKAKGFDNITSGEKIEKIK